MNQSEIASWVATHHPAHRFQGKRVLLIIPDGTRTAPIGAVFKALHAQWSEAVAALDILIALGTHPAMSEEAICERLEITREERASRYQSVGFYNHEWDNPAALETLGVIPADEIRTLSDGLFAMDVPVSINRRVLTYDQIVIIGPVFPHEVVGFSGGNKYLFPGVSGPEILNFFHWLGAVITTVGVIGQKWTPVRRVVDRAGAMVPIPKLCLALVVKPGGNGELAGIFSGTPEAAWDQAADLSAQTHIEWKDRQFHTILSCAPAMYDELWVGAKCMYKLEPVLAPGGELIIYAPHLHEVSVVHGALIRQVGYHCRDYFLKQWTASRISRGAPSLTALMSSDRAPMKMVLRPVGPGSRWRPEFQSRYAARSTSATAIGAPSIPLNSRGGSPRASCMCPKPEKPSTGSVAKSLLTLPSKNPPHG